MQFESCVAVASRKGIGDVQHLQRARHIAYRRGPRRRCRVRLYPVRQRLRILVPGRSLRHAGRTPLRLFRSSCRFDAQDIEKRGGVRDRADVRCPLRGGGHVLDRQALGKTVDVC
jgi:hypothetical protein